MLSGRVQKTKNTACQTTTSKQLTEFRINITNDSKGQCGSPFGDSIHYIMECPLHQKKKKLSGEMQRSQLFFQIYTFLDSGFSTLIEYRNDFKFSADFCTISLCNPREISIMDLALYKYPVVMSFASFLHFYGDKDNHTVFFLCV